jgi:predicted ester cyclase
MNQSNANLELAKNVYRGIDAADFEQVEKLVSPRFRASMGGKELDLAAWREMGRMFMTAFPDGRHVFDLMETAGEFVVSHGYFTGTHQQEFLGIPANRKVIKISVTMIDKIVDGKLVEHYGDFDSAGLMQQLTQ